MFLIIQFEFSHISEFGCWGARVVEMGVASTAARKGKRRRDKRTF